MFCEASAFGLPLITTNTGGIPTIVEDGVNGYKLPLEATGREFAKKIIEVYSNTALYNKMRISSRNKFDEVLNWDKAGLRLSEHIHNFLNK